MKSMWFGRLVTLVLLSVMAAATAGVGTGCATTDEKEDNKKLKDADWHYKMGAGYFESREIPLAIRELHTALKMNADHSEAHHLLGFIYMGRREYPKAIKHFKETLRVKPEHHFAKNNLGTVYLSMERWKEAEEIFKQLLEEPLYTTPELAHNNLGWVYYNRRRYQKAIEHFKMATFLKPQMCLAYNNMGRTYEAMRQTGRATQNYRKAIQKCPQNYAEPHFYLGKLLQSQGDPSARAHFEKCLEMQPDSNLGERCRQYLQVR